MKIYIETDCILGLVTFKDSGEEWSVGKYDWENLMKVLLTPTQYISSFEKDFCGYISFKRYKAAKAIY